MRSIYSPAASWRDLDSAGKFLAYNKWSMQGGIVLYAVLLAAFSDSAWVIAAIVASAAVSVWALQVQPALRLKAAPERPRTLIAGSAFLVALTAAGWLSGSPTLVTASLLGLVSAFTPFVPRWRWWTFAVVVAGAALLAFGLEAAQLAVLPLACALYTPLILWTVRLMNEAHRARVLESRLRVSEERLRFAQDLHDTLGQHLAAMSIKTQLAAKFAALNDARLTGELSELQSLIEATVSDMHGVVDNYRSRDLDQEITAAVSLLEQAGISVATSGSATALPTTAHDTAAWFIRETATNVLRHSQATHVKVTIEPRRIAVTNNAPHPADGSAGTGLDNLARRAAAIGARVDTDHSPIAFTAALELP
ncbi:sensor histidine kinase [Corynebacterium sp.]|uniref:sensor histidine kinase n=1 Tax=Corynebacterium sp. TaxID=1720 RepID=UPI002A910B98|nr:histidine kinase [Corynebacterium sp.]MDY5785396.1 histidine kinase [Corynebacterium sp.]